MDFINNYQNDLSDNDEDYVLPDLSNTSLTDNDNRDFYLYVDYDARYQHYMSLTEYTEGVSETKYQNWINEEARKNYEVKNQVDDRIKFIPTSDSRSEGNVTSSSTSSERIYISKNHILKKLSMTISTSIDASIFAIVKGLDYIVQNECVKQMMN